MTDNVAQDEANFLAEEQWDSSDPEQVNQRKQKIARGKKTHLNYVKTILADPEGRKWLYRCITNGNIFAENFSIQEDTRTAAFREGMKVLPLKLMADARVANPNLFNAMMKEGEDNGLGILYPTKGLL